MSTVHVVLDRVGQGRLRSCWTCPQTATRFYVEFSDSLAGSVGLSSFLAMLRIVCGYPVSVSEGAADVHSEAVRAVLAGDHPIVRFDGRYAVPIKGGAQNEAANA